MKPFRLNFGTVDDKDAAAIERNILASKSFPRTTHRQRSHPVAVVGGGPLLDVEAVRNWPGDVWAINRTADFLLNRGIDCTFFTVDPADFLTTTAAKRLLASHCDPSLFVGDVECFPLAGFEAGGSLGGTSTATCAPLLAISMGYPGVVFFGCEGSFSGADHVDRDDKPERQIIVRANGHDWKTVPQMLMQSQELSWFIKNCPAFREESGGLLRAMVNDDDWEVVAVNAAMRAHLIENNGDIGLYDAPYEPINQLKTEGAHHG